MVIALIGDPIYLLRVWASMLLGLGVVAVGYWFVLPTVLPLWPALVALVLNAVVGILWEHLEHVAYLSDRRQGPQRLHGGCRY